MLVVRREIVRVAGQQPSAVSSEPLDIGSGNRALA
jgi:hypothetical protein